MAVILTDHAIRRAQQRGIPIKALYFTAIHGKAKRARGRLIQRTLRDRDVAKMVDNRVVSPRESYILAGLSVRTEETSGGSLVITIFRCNS